MMKKIGEFAVVAVLIAAMCAMVYLCCAWLVDWLAGLPRAAL